MKGLYMFKIKVLIVVILIAMVMTNGCASKNRAMQHGNKTKGNLQAELEVLTTEPASPAVLEKGQKVNVEIYYEIGADANVVIWARPYYKGKLAGSYSAHHLIPCSGAKERSGQVMGWITFGSAAEADEIHVTMRDAGSKEILKTCSYKVNLKWKGDIQKASETPKPCRAKQTASDKQKPCCGNQTVKKTESKNCGNAVR